MTGFCEFTIHVNRPVRHVTRVARLERPEEPASPPLPVGPRNPPDLQSLLTEMADSLRQWRSAHEEFAATFREVVVQLALTIAARIVRHRIDAEAYNLPGLVEEIWTRLDRGAAALFLHPADLRQLETQHAVWLQEQVGSSSVVLRTDAGLPRGSCRVEGQHESFLAGVDVELAGLADWLKGDAEE